jgi:hypothetical protein
VSQTEYAVSVMIAATTTALAFGIWRKNFWAGIYMFSLLMFIIKFSGMLQRFAMGKYQLP